MSKVNYDSLEELEEKLNDFNYSSLEELEEKVGTLEPDEIYVTLVYSNNLWYFLLDESTYSFIGGKDLLELIKPLEKMYMEYHLRDYTSSMSATLNYIYYQYAVIKIKEKEIKNLLEDTQIWKLSNVAGRIIGVKLKQEKYEIMNQKAEPKLISYKNKN